MTQNFQNKVIWCKISNKIKGKCLRKFTSFHALICDVRWVYMKHSVDLLSENVKKSVPQDPEHLSKQTGNCMSSNHHFPKDLRFSPPKTAISLNIMRPIIGKILKKMHSLLQDDPVFQIVFQVTWSEERYLCFVPVKNWGCVISHCWEKITLTLVPDPPSFSLTYHDQILRGRITIIQTPSYACIMDHMIHYFLGE